MLIAVSGMAGAGKTTSIAMLERLGVGERVYVGSLVISEVTRRGLPATPASEKHVRDQLRQERGMDALACAALPTIEGILSAGQVALVDAIYNKEERSLYERAFRDRLVCVGVESSFENRLRRLRKRPGRSLAEADLELRDRYELDHLGLEEVIESSHHRINNDATLDSLEEALKALVRDLLA